MARKKNKPPKAHRKRRMPVSRAKSEEITNSAKAGWFSKAMVVFSVLCVVGLGYGWWITNQSARPVMVGIPEVIQSETQQQDVVGDDTGTKKEPEVEEQSLPNYRVGGAYWCRGIPPFVNQLELQQPVGIDTRQSRYPGVVIRELRGSKIYRHPSWAQTGAVAPTVMDKRGNVYVIPVPGVSLDINPIAKSQEIYKIDARSGEMKSFMSLPYPQNQSTKNPFGTMGLAMDCDTDTLYVSSVAGSTPRRELGVIYKIDLDKGQITDRFENQDVLGLAVFNFKNEKRLYLGSARSSNIFSIGIDLDGNFAEQDAVYEFSLATIKDGDTTSAKRLQFTRVSGGGHTMLISETEFGFRLTAETARTYKQYQFTLDQATKHWDYVGLANR